MNDVTLKHPTTRRLYPSVDQGAAPVTPTCGCPVGQRDSFESFPDLSFTIDLANPDLDEKD